MHEDGAVTEAPLRDSGGRVYRRILSLSEPLALDQVEALEAHASSAAPGRGRQVAQPESLLLYRLTDPETEAILGVVEVVNSLEEDQCFGPSEVEQVRLP